MRIDGPTEASRLRLRRAVVLAARDQLDASIRDLAAYSDLVAAELADALGRRPRRRRRRRRREQPEGQ